MALSLDFVLHADLPQYLWDIPQGVIVETLAMNDEGVIVSVDDAP